jgi:hypothetical protein
MGSSVKTGELEYEYLMIWKGSERENMNEKIRK